MCGLSEDATMTKESAVIAKDGEWDVGWTLIFSDNTEKVEREREVRGNKNTIKTHLKTW